MGSRPSISGTVYKKGPLITLFKGEKTPRYNSWSVTRSERTYFKNYLALFS